MERTKQAVDKKEKGIKWINNGGRFYMKNGKVIEHGKTFYAPVEDVPKAFRDVIRPVDPLAVVETATEPEVEQAVPIFNAKRRGSSEFYDIYDGNGKRQNDKDLTKKEAGELIAKLMSN